MRFVDSTSLAWRRRPITDAEIQPDFKEDPGPGVPLLHQNRGSRVNLKADLSSGIDNPMLPSKKKPVKTQ